MPIIRFYRHAESFKNTNPDVVGGQSKASPLTLTGERQAIARGASYVFRQREFVAAFHSGAERAEQTGILALCSSGVEIPLQKHEGLLEISQGIWEGIDRRALPDGETKPYTHPYTRGLNGRVTGGESIAEVGQRKEAALLEIAGSYADSEEIAVFGHDFALRCLRVRLEHNDLQYIREGVAHCSETTIVAESGRLCIVQLGVPLL